MKVTLRLPSGMTMALTEASVRELATALIEVAWPIGSPSRSRMAKLLWEAVNAPEDAQVDLDPIHARYVLEGLNAIEGRGELAGDLADLAHEVRLQLGLL